MAKTCLKASLDMGGGRIACLIGEQGPLGVTVRGGALVACRGLKGGVVVNIAETARAVRAAVEGAEEAAQRALGAEIVLKGVTVGVRGSHLQSGNNRGSINLNNRSDKEITAEDVESVLQATKAISIPPDREIVRTIPQSFTIDRQEGIPNPVGMNGSLLEAHVHIITAFRSHMNNLEKAVADAGFEVQERVCSQLALAQLVMAPEERELGALLLDIGGQTLSLAIYADNAVRFTKELAIGADFITKDLAAGLRTTMPVADALKRQYGVAHPQLMGEDAEIGYVGVDGRTQHTVRTETLMSIILPRVEEIFDLVAKEVQGSEFANVIVPTGAVLSGGGAMLRGMAQAAQKVLGMPARFGLPQPGLAEVPPEYGEPEYATALALLVQPEGGGGERGGMNGGSFGEALLWAGKIRRFLRDVL